MKSKLCIGTSNFGYPYGLDNKIIEIKEVEKILKFCIKNNINYLDTSPSYNNYKFLNKVKINYKKFKIIVKFSLKYLDENKLDISKFIFKILKKFKINKLEAVLIHDSNDLKNKKSLRLLSELHELKKKNIINKIGISVYDTKEHEFFKKKFKFDIIQFPLNFFDRDFINKKIIKHLKKNKIEIHVRSIFLQNLLLKDVSQNNNYFKNWNKILKVWDAWHDKNNQRKLDTCLSFIKKQNFINRVIIGINSKAQLQEILRSKNVKIPKNIKINEKAFTKPNLWKLK